VNGFSEYVDSVPETIPAYIAREIQILGASRAPHEQGNENYREKLQTQSSHVLRTPDEPAHSSLLSEARTNTILGAHLHPDLKSCQNVKGRARHSVRAVHE